MKKVPASATCVHQDIHIDSLHWMSVPSTFHMKSAVYAVQVNRLTLKSYMWCQSNFTSKGRRVLILFSETEWVTGWTFSGVDRVDRVEININRPPAPSLLIINPQWWGSGSLTLFTTAPQEGLQQSHIIYCSLPWFTAPHDVEWTNY